MNLAQAFTYMFRDRTATRRLGLLALASMIPIVGQCWALGYANLLLRRMVKGNGDESLPEVQLGWELCRRGLRVLLVMMASGVVVALLGAPLFIGEDESATVIAPAIVQALQGPSALLVTVVSAVVTGVVLARFALADSILSSLHPGEIWSLLRAEPAIWIAYTATGFVLTEGAYGLVWVLPLHGDWDTGATVTASTVVWTYGLLINTHLIGQAYQWSRRSAALRAANIGYQR